MFLEKLFVETYVFVIVLIVGINYTFGAFITDGMQFKRSYWNKFWNEFYK